MTSNQTLISSRLKMFQNLSGTGGGGGGSVGGKPPPLPAKPVNIHVTASQAKSAAKFVKANVKVSDVITAMEVGSEIYGITNSNNNYYDNRVPSSKDIQKSSGKVLATAKFLETALPAVQQQQQQKSDLTNFGHFQKPTTSAFTSKPLPTLPPHPPPTVVKPNFSNMANSSSKYVAMDSSVGNSWNSGKIKELTSKLQEAPPSGPPTVVKPRPISSNLDKNSSIKTLKADLESKLQFGPPTVIYSNRRRSSSSQNQDFNSNVSPPQQQHQQQRTSVSYHSGISTYANENYENSHQDNFYSTNTNMVSVLPINKSKSPPPGRPPVPKLGQQQHEPYATVLYDFDSQEDDELNCKAGDRVMLKHEVDNEWLYACNSRTQSSGIVPKAYLDIKIPLPVSSAPKSPSGNNKNSDGWDDDSGVDSAHDGPRCYTLHDFNSGEASDLAFCQGEIVRLIARINAEWLEGEAHDGRRGIFPASFVEVIEDLPSTTNSSPRPQSGFIASNNERHGSPDLKPLIAIALYDFDGSNEGDLSFRAGEEIEVVNVINEEWSEGVSLLTGKTGIFPSNFVEYIPDDKSPSPKLPAQHPPLPTQNVSLVGKTAVALYDYKSHEKQDLNFQAGDEIEVINVLDGDWLEGRLVIGLSNKRCWPVGLLPRNYVQF